MLVKALVTLVLAVSYAAMSGFHGADAHAPITPRRCTDERLLIARRIYEQAAAGRVSAGAAARLERSPALAAAVARGDRAATVAALRPLMRAAIRRIVIRSGGRTLVSLGRAAAVAPVSGFVGGGRFTLSTTTDGALARMIEELTGSRVRFGRRGALEATAFPSGAVHIRLSGGTPQCTVLDAGKRLLAAETAGPRTEQVLRIVGDDPAFAQAVATDDAAALRAQIVRFFQEPALHVVRIRATDASGRLVNDVGGPYVLAPASGPVRLDGRTVGTVTLSIQDDAGYIKLMNRFTGAAVQLRTPAGIVPGSQSAHGPSFSGTAFPAGPLRITLGSGATSS
jgi:hypothetical protein